MNRRKAIQNLRKQMRTIEDVDKLVALTRAGNVLPDGFDSYEDLETQPE
ncbi:MAG: hypothetical protein ABSG41_23165 [Bryobacteraceae bacterium]